VPSGPRRWRRGERREVGGAGHRQPIEVQAQPCAEAALTAGTPNFSTLLSEPFGLSFSVHVRISMLEVMLKAMPESKPLSSLAIG
jgi:hypothetical protein